MQQGETISCEVYESRKARVARIRLSREGNLSVVIPAGFRKDLIPSLLESKRDWIRRNLSRIRAATPQSPGEASSRPTQVNLEAFGEAWEVLYDRGSVPGERLVEDQKARRLILFTGESQDAGCLLRKWLMKRSRFFLAPRLGELSERQKMPYRRLSIRLQGTRWGSCSAKGNISLNAKLSFLPGSLVDYVLCHELCHTIHMDHSRSFWELLERTLPGSLVLRKALRKGEIRVPGWAERGKSQRRASVPPERLTITLQ